MKAHRFLAHCLATPWAMDPSAMTLYATMLARAYAVRDGIVAGDEEGPPPMMAAGTRSNGARQGSIAVVRVFGPIMQRASSFGPCESGASAEDIGAALAAAEGDETIAQVLMEFDTPGGSVFGIRELGDQIRGMSKPVVGLANSMSASAGYWLLSQCTEAYVTPGGMVGSIGVYTAHEDMSKALEALGVKVTLISAGKFKIEGNPFEPLGEEAHAHTQSEVNDYYDMFVRAVARGRKVGVDDVRNGMGQGRMLLANAAVEQKLVDGVATFGEVVKKMQRAQQAAKPARSARAAMARELEILG